ncbi:winged helix-turn-helix transcriptional regulator (plasmid) [Halorussus limi]|uniref:Winged helix-turn-helix transcriptional regulator n=1 Tax=Halorussus limi TaxID=2938695 RepID=A0A8U0I0H1_9EURY|nr:winged helix-turn-helix transcriptional regulator [Halorussus limi]UPV76875.1 winged helix-turn-helix transcriptional regulator [Halorussus limi]
MSVRLDEIDKRILYHLARDARGISAPDIAEEVNVSAGTIRNRIRQLEEKGIIEGYHARIDYERAERRLTNLFICTTDVPDRERIAKQVADIPGVTDVRELMTGRGNLHVAAVGEDMADLSRVARDLANLGIDIEEENLIQQEYRGPYDAFGPEDGPDAHSITDFMNLSGGAEVVELVVSSSAQIADLTLQEANKRGIIDSEALIISIERDEAMLTPKGDTHLRPDDVVTLFSRNGIDEETISAFGDR